MKREITKIKQTIKLEVKKYNKLENEEVHLLGYYAV
jgi:hypothetical protein